MGEHLPSKEKVAGSIPASRSKRPSFQFAQENNNESANTKRIKKVSFPIYAKKAAIKAFIAGFFRVWALEMRE